MKMTGYEFIKRIANFKDKRPLRWFMYEIAGVDSDNISEKKDKQLDEFLNKELMTVAEYNEIAKENGEEEIK